MEVPIFEGRHLDFQHIRNSVAVEESTRKTHPDLVERSNEALVIARRLAKLWTNVPLLCNADGVPRKRSLIDCAFFAPSRRLAASDLSARSARATPTKR